jgi:hypothetical protein
MKFITLLILFTFTSSIMALEDKVILKNVKKMGKELKRELKSGMKKSPKEALEICNIKAPIIEQKYKKSNLKIGRVSLKSRNPNNKPKKWMLKYIEDFHKKKITKDYIIVDIDGARKGFLKPIITMPLCLKCHGANIDSALSKEILNRYPNDKAIGFSVGDIRGFFWSEYDK